MRDTTRSKRGREGERGRIKVVGRANKHTGHAVRMAQRGKEGARMNKEPRG